MQKFRCFVGLFLSLIFIIWPSLSPASSISISFYLKHPLSRTLFISNILYLDLSLSWKPCISNSLYLEHYLSRTLSISNILYLEFSLSRKSSISNSLYLEHPSISNQNFDTVLQILSLSRTFQCDATCRKNSEYSIQNI